MADGNHDLKRGIILDVDGTLWDAVEVITQSWNVVLNTMPDVQGEISADQMRGCLGKTMFEIADRLFGYLPLPRRRQVLEEAMRYGDLVQIHEGNAIVLDLDLVSKPVLVKMKETVEERSEREKEALGFHLSDHPVQIMRQNYGIDDPSIASFVGRKGEVTGFGVITGVHTHRTKYGDMMAFLKVSDETGQADIAVMPDLYKQNAGMMVRGTYLRFRAKINEDGSMRALKIRIIKKSE